MATRSTHKRATGEQSRPWRKNQTRRKNKEKNFLWLVAHEDQATSSNAVKTLQNEHCPHETSGCIKQDRTKARQDRHSAREDSGTTSGNAEKKKKNRSSLLSLRMNNDITTWIAGDEMESQRNHSQLNRVANQDSLRHHATSARTKRKRQTRLAGTQSLKAVRARVKIRNVLHAD